MLKKSIFLIIAFIFQFTIFVSAATVWSVSAGDISATFSNSSFLTGDTIELTASGTSGSYTWTTKVGTLTKSFTLRAGSSVLSRPVVTLPTGVTLSTNNNTDPFFITFDGIDFDGNKVATGLTSAKAAAGGNLKVTMNNCVVRNFTSTSRVFAYASTGTNWSTQAQWYDDLMVTNSEFTGTYAGVITFGSQFAGPDNTTFRNCYFSGLTATIINNGLASLNTTTSLTLDHCTFNASTGIEINIKNGGTSTTIVRNSIFANSPGSSTATNVVALGTNPGNTANKNNAVFYSTAANNVQAIGTRYPSGLLGAYITANPMLTMNFATATAYIGTATDNRNIGYYNFKVLTPFISVSTNTINGLSYNQNNGPSAEQSFTVSAFDLTNALLISPSSHLEIRTASSSFSSNAISLAPLIHEIGQTIIFVRLKAGLAINSYSESISLTNTGATSRSIICPAQVISASPNIQVSVSSLSGFSRFQDGGFSKPQSFDVIGANLTSNIFISPPSDFEISLTPTKGYSSNPISISQVGGVVNTKVYVRMSTNLAAGSSLQDLTLGSNGAVGVNLSCSGSIVSIPTSNFNTNATSNVDLRIASNNSAAAMPIFSTLDHVNRVFVRNPDCWASDLDLTCISPSNFSYNNLHAGTLITPRHAILAAHFKLATGDSIYFVTNENETIRRKIIGYKVNTQFSPIQFPDIEIVTLDSDIPSTIKPCVFLPSNYATYLSNNGRGIPILNSDQEKKALVSQLQTFNSLTSINGNPSIMMLTEQTCSTAPRLALHEAVISGDSGNPRFIILRGQLVLLSAVTWSDGSGTSYTNYANLPSGGTLNSMSINDLIQQSDGVAGVNTGYQVSYFNFTNPTTQIKLFEQNDKVNAYTVDNKLFVKFNSIHCSKISIFNIMGHEILNEAISSLDFSCQLAKKGIYLVVLETNLKRSSFKIVIK